MATDTTASSPNAANDSSSLHPNTATSSSGPGLLSHTVKRASLLDLPVELRLQILRHATTPSADPVHHEVGSSLCLLMDTDVRHAVRGLSCACAQLHSETDQVFYKRHRFTFHFRPSLTSSTTTRCDITSFMQIIRYGEVQIDTGIRGDTTLLDLLKRAMRTDFWRGALGVQDFRCVYVPDDHHRGIVESYGGERQVGKRNWLSQ